jgi:hypothetical protein
MNSFFGFVVGILQSTLSLLGFVQQHPELPPASKDQAIQVTQQVINQATREISKTSGHDSLTISPVKGPVPLSATLTATVNADNSCSERNFVLVYGDFNEITRQELGDGTGYDVINVPKDLCAPKTVTFHHIYSDCGSEIGKPLGICEPGVYEKLGNGQTKPIASAAIKLTSATEISVPGLEKYTDSDFGFSFWYPSGWKNTNIPIAEKDSFVDHRVEIVNGETVVKELLLSDGKDSSNDIRIFEVNSPDRSFYAAGNGKWPGTKFYFNPTTHTWMSLGTNVPSETGGTAADVSINSMGGLHLFELPTTIVVPLSAQYFVVVETDQLGQPNRDHMISLAKTIVASDPSVATLVSAAQQQATIQAEAAAYGVSSANSAQGTKVFSAIGYPFKLSYPNDFTLAKDITASQKDRTLSYISTTCDDRAACLYYTGSDVTDIQAAAFSIQASSKPTYEQCLKVAMEKTETVSMSGVSWLKDATGDAGLGNRLSTIRYRTYYNGTCYQAELSTGWNVGMQDSSLTTIQKKMQATMNSFQFTVPQTIEPWHSGATPEWATLVGTAIPISFKYPGSFIVEENNADGIGVAKGSYVGVGVQADDDYGGQISIQPDPSFSSVADAGQRSQYRNSDGSNGTNITVGGQPAYQFKDKFSGTNALYIMIAGEMYEIVMFDQIGSPAIPNEWETFISSFKFTQ